MNRTHEHFPGRDREQDIASGDLEKLGVELREKLRSEMDEEFGRKFEAPAHLENEDEKNRRAELDASANELQTMLNEVAENISQATHQLASLPLTGEQTALLDRINELLAKRTVTNDATEQNRLDDEIETTTKRFAALPVTPEQGALLDDILGLIDLREKTTLKLQEIRRGS